MRTTRSLFALLVAALLVFAACRPMAVETDPGPAFSVEVNNPMPHPMIIYYEDDRGTHLLGTVSADGRAEFIITDPADQMVRIVATDEGRTHRVERDVRLDARTPAQVTLTL